MPLALGALLGGALKWGSVLARAKLIRGAGGQLLKGAGKRARRLAPGAIATTGAGLAIQGTFGSVESLPVYMPGGAVREASVGTAIVRTVGGGAIVRGVGGALVKARKWPRRILSLIAAGLAFEVGDRIIDALTGKDITPKRRMNFANGRALARSIRRMEGASKQYARVLRATTKGVKKCGYTITPKKRPKRCA